MCVVSNSSLCNEYCKQVQGEKVGEIRGFCGKSTKYGTDIVQYVLKNNYMSYQAHFFPEDQSSQKSKMATVLSRNR